MTMPEFKDILSVGGSIITFIGVILLVYKTFTDPDKKSEKDLSVMTVACVAKHSRIDEIFADIKEQLRKISGTFEFFQQNDFKHIEDNTKDINVKMATMDGKMDVIIKLMEKKEIK